MPRTAIASPDEHPFDERARRAREKEDDVRRQLRQWRYWNLDLRRENQLPPRQLAIHKRTGGRCEGADFFAVRELILDGGEVDRRAVVLDVKQSLRQARHQGCNWYSISDSSVGALERDRAQWHQPAFFWTGDDMLMTPEEVRDGDKRPVSERIGRDGKPYRVVCSAGGQAAETVLGIDKPILAAKRPPVTRIGATIREYAVPLPFNWAGDEAC